ncbi:transposase, partial [Bacteroidales bacterium OttesenSCG-928-A14]|nr:transposase [Bacteroidales bacterium OttesenSCG-928-A14]
KAKVAIEAIQERESVESLCKKHGLHPNQIRDWKKEFLSASHRIFDKEDLGKKVKCEEELISELYRQIGELKVDNEFLKKKLKPYQ